MGATIITNLEFNLPAAALERHFLIPATVMFDIGKKYCDYRESVILSKRQMGDLSAMIPLKLETIARKAGTHKARQAGKAAVRTKVLARLRKGSQIFAMKKRYVSQHPDVPLVDTGNLLRSPVGQVHASPGLLTIGLGPQRAQIGMYHQLGMGHNPQRVHHSWNEEFWKTKALPIIAAWLDLVLRKAI